MRPKVHWVQVAASGSLPVHLARASLLTLSSAVPQHPLLKTSQRAKVFLKANGHTSGPSRAADYNVPANLSFIPAVNNPLLRHLLLFASLLQFPHLQNTVILHTTITHLLCVMSCDELHVIKCDELVYSLSLVGTIVSTILDASTCSPRRNLSRVQAVERKLPNGNARLPREI